MWTGDVHACLIIDPFGDVKLSSGVHSGVLNVYSHL